MYQIPKQIKSEVKITQIFYLRDVAVFILVMTLAYMFDSLVHMILKVPYYIFVAGITFYFILPSRSNPKKRNYHSLYYTMMRNRVKYFRIYDDNEEGENREHAVR